MKRIRGEKGHVLALASFIVLLLSISSFGQKSTRITFTKGADSTVVTGGLNGYKQTKWYKIRVRKGQTLKTEQVGSRHHITIHVLDSRGNELGDSDASCNNRREITETEADDYNIYVEECQKAGAWRGQFKFRITVR